MAVSGAIAVGVAGVASASAQKSAAKRAANAQVDAANTASATDLKIYNDQKALLTPAALSGATAGARQRLMTGSSLAEANQYLADTYKAYGRSDAPTISDWNPTAFLESTPGYQFRRDQGQLGVERSAAARGGLFSGETGKALTDYNSDYASNEWDKLYGELGDQSGQGSSATSGVINASGAYGTAVNNSTLAAGDARASGYLAQGNAAANGYAAIGQGAGKIYGYGQQQKWWS